uniref:Uncharacterized protein n=1 Tax=Aegilops tauschii subsp. strangulata TaxID=200361 RepID=A0A453Q2Z2_AEGTS
MLSAVPMSMLMVLCAQGLAKATTVAPTSTSLLPNLLLHLRRSSLLNVPMMAQRCACAALCVCCLQALAEQVRCMYCEYHGSRIVHPTRVSFRGRNIEFEKMLCGEGVYSKSFTNNGIIAHSREASDCVGAVVDDCIYDVYRRDDTPIKAEDFVRMSDANVVFD